MAAAGNPFPPIDFTKFTWVRSEEDPSLYSRAAAGGEILEDFFTRFAVGEQNLFLGINITLDVPTPADAFLAIARDAWQAIRRTIPHVAAHIDYDAEDRPLVTYRAPKDNAEVSAWVDRVVVLHESMTDLDELRTRLSQTVLPDQHGDATLVHILPFSETSYGILIHSNHIMFDSTGSKTLATDFFQKLAADIANPSEGFDDAPWGVEVEHLLPAAPNVMVESEVTSGEGYVRTLGTIMNDVLHGTSHMWGFKQRNIGPGPTRRFGYKFSAAETKQLIAAAEAQGLTLNLIIHAAVFLVCAQDNPPPSGIPDDIVLMNIGITDGRSRLRAPYSWKHGYPGYCIATSPIMVPVKLFVSNAGKTQKEQVLAAAAAMKPKYEQQAAYPALLAMQPQQAEMSITEMKSNPAPPPWMGPWYVSEGAAENILDREYAVDGKAVITITDFFTSVNKTNPGPFFRNWTWQDELVLSVDFNENAMPAKDVQGFLEKWAEFIRLVL